LKKWRDIKKWFCSELAAAALELAKIIGAIFSGYNKIPPEMLANMVGIFEGRDLLGLIDAYPVVRRGRCWVEMHPPSGLCRI
jgi:hypothetical protein